MKRSIGIIAGLFLLLVNTVSAAQPETAGSQSKAGGPVDSVKVTILSTMLAEKGIGEWGFSALVEVEEKRILFDTGWRPYTVWQNVLELGIDLSQVTDVILSHHHGDHTGGLLTLRRGLSMRNPAALSRVHVGRGMFSNRRVPGSAREINTMLATRLEYEATGGEIIEHDKPFEMFEGVWLTGPVPMLHEERNWSGSRTIKTSEGLIEDTVPEDLSLVVDTVDGLVVISGCGHAGIINTLEHAQKTVRQARVYAILGGFHLFKADDHTLAWTAEKLQDFGLGHLLGAHCTGIEAVYRIRRLAGLDRATAVVGAVGSSFSLDGGIDPLRLAK